MAANRYILIDEFIIPSFQIQEDQSHGIYRFVYNTIET